MTERVPLYDSGMLSALADRKPMAHRLHEGLRATRHRAVVIGPVLAQVWRPSPAVVHALSTVMRDCSVPQARSSLPPMRETAAGPVGCMACQSGFDVTDWRRVGSALGQAALPPKKQPDAVDAWVALAAARHGRAVVFTSDAADMAAYLTALNASDVHVVSV